ncbi:hypothetical protein OpiT1DRAFT_04238 [Opitutaceae bacterium TAV1]|nr:hypothetical protein OpiT1DRAFT_04238 [Opitutaceae bacterium TAV1]
MFATPAIACFTLMLSRMKTSRFLLSVALLLPATAPALVITFDYTYDTGGFFSNPAAKAALEAAAADISSVLGNTTLGALQSSYAGSHGSANATLSWQAGIKHPTTGGALALLPPLAANVFTIYVGAQPLSGGTLGQGGPAGLSYGINGSTGSQADWDAAVNAAANAASAGLTRGGGPIIGTTTGGVSFGLLAGNLWFDNDNSAKWHFDHTTAVASDAYDFYSVALHEILHTLGYGIGDTWEALSAGGVWSGLSAAGVSIDDGHLASGTQGESITGSGMQDAVMTPSIANGVRKYLTDLDLAILGDLGYTVGVIPEPAAVAWMAALAIMAVVLTCRRR